MARINGNNLTLVFELTDDNNEMAFAHTQNSSISFTNNLVEATLGPSNGWAEYVSGVKSSTINFEGLTDYGTITNRYNIDDVGDFFLEATPLYFQIGRQVEGFNFGYGKITELTLTGETDGVSTYSGVFTIDGNLFVDTEGEAETLQDSDGEDILDDAGRPITVKIIPTE